MYSIISNCYKSLNEVFIYFQNSFSVSLLNLRMGFSVTKSQYNTCLRHYRCLKPFRYVVNYSGFLIFLKIFTWVHYSHKYEIYDIYSVLYKSVLYNDVVQAANNFQYLASIRLMPFYLELFTSAVKSLYLMKCIKIVQLLILY